MGLGFILFAGGLVIVLGVYLWSRQRLALGYIPTGEPSAHLNLPPLATSDDAVVVSREHGQVVFVNEKARHWLGMNGGEPTLEHIAALAQPADSLLELFAGEGQASFQFGERWVEASSHAIPAGAETRTVVVMREITANPQHPGSLDLSMAINTINEIGETINASMGIQQVYQALLAIIMKASPASAGEICRWDDTKKQLTPQGWAGDARYLIRLQEEGGIYRQGEGISGWIAAYQKPVLVSDVSASTAIQPKLPGFFNSFVAVPLMLGERFIGTLELAHRQAGAFNQSHLAFLQAVSKQVAIAIYNAQLYSEQTQRISDMASVGELMSQGRVLGDARNVYRLLTERLAKLTSAGMAGILIYDENRRALVPELPFYGLPDHLAQSYLISVPPDSPQRDIWERQEYWVTNDAADESLIEALGLKSILSVAGIRNLALLPLQIGDQRIGMAQIANKKSAGGFTPQDIREMRLLVNQAAVVVENLRLFQRGRRREAELSGLQEITHAIGALSREEEFYSSINQRIAQQMNITMCGILLYDRESHRLVSQPPFYGVADELIRDYTIELEPGSPLESIWEEVDSWYSNRVQSDAVVHAAGLAELASKLGVQKTLLAVLSVGGERLGVVQASNKLNGEDFTDTDAHLLLIFATQVAAMIENARLYRDMQRNADLAISLRQVAELAGEVLTPEDSFMPILAEISRLTHSPLVFVNVLDQQTGSLITYPRWVYGTELAEPIVFDIHSPQFEQSTALSQQPFISNDLSEDARVLPAYRQVIERVGLSRVVLVPLILGDRSLGELGIANRGAQPYTKSDTELLESIAAQIAATIERLRLYEAAGQNLNRRLLELDAISRISNELAATLDLNHILNMIRLEAERATNAVGSTIALLKPASNWAAPNQPEIDQRIGPASLSLELRDIEREAVQRGANAVLVTDYGNSPMNAAPPAARSALATAFLYEDRVVGVLHLYHDRPNSFDDRAAAFLMTLAAKASLGYGNYVRYQEQVARSDRLRQRVEQLNQIFELGRTLQGNVEQESALENILESIQRAAGFSYGVVVLYDEDTNQFERVAQLGMPLDAFAKSKAATMSRTDLEQLLKESFRISESYFFPIERKGDWLTNGLPALTIAFPGKRVIQASNDEHAWQPGDLLLMVLRGNDGQIIGVVSLDQPQNGLRPDRTTLEVIEIFARQAETFLENSRLYQASIQNAEQEARLNEMLQAASQSLDTEQIVEAISYGTLRLVPFHRMTLALNDVEGQGFDVFRIALQADNSPVIDHEHKPYIDGTVLARVVELGRELFIPFDDPDAESYPDLRAWRSQGEKVSLILPLLSGGLGLGAMHMGSEDADPHHFEVFVPLLKRIANLAAVSIQNARLFSQAMNLRNFNESVVESIQQGIVVLDKSGHIISINDFMRFRYRWNPAEALRQDLFAYRRELIPLLQADVRAVLEGGKPRERIGQSTYEPDNDLLVRNFYIYPLRSGESIRGAVLLVEDVTERHRLETDLEARANQLGALTEVSSRITASLNREEVINLALEEIGHIIQFDAMTLWTRTGDMLTLEGALGFEIAPSDQNLEIQIDAHERMSALIEKKAPYFINHFEGWDKLPGEDQAQSWLGVPLVTQGHVVGVISLAKREPSFYNAQAEQAAFTFANQVAIALENANLYAEARYQTERLSLLNRVSILLAQSLDSENIVEIALREIAQTMNVTRARAMLLDRGLQTGRVVMEYPRGDTPPDETISLQTSAVHRTIRRTAAPLAIEDLSALDENDPVRLELEPRGARAYLIIPMTVAGQVTGAFDMEIAGGPRRFTPEQIDLGLIIANQAAIAVQNTNLLEQTLTRTQELETLLEAAQATALTLNLDDAYTSVAGLMLQALEMDDCAVMMWDNVENTLNVEFDVSLSSRQDRVALEGGKYDLKRFPTKFRALGKSEIIVIRAEQDDEAPEERAELIQQGAALRVLLPLVVRDQAIGLIQAQRYRAVPEFSHREIRLAQALGAQAAIAIQNARLSTETAALVEEGFLINKLSQSISSTLKIEDMIAIIRDQVPQVTRAEQMYLALIDPASESITFPMAVKNGELFEIPARKLNTDEVSFVIKHRRSLSLGSGNWSSDEMRRNLGISSGEDDALSYLGVPIAAGDQVLGVLALRDTRNPRAFGINDERLLMTVGSQLGAAIQNARLFERVNNFANELNQRVKERTDELQMERDRLDTLYRITSELARTLDMDRVLRRALEMVSQAVGADEGVIMLIDPLSDRLVTRAALHVASDEPVAPEVTQPANLVANWLLQHNHVLIANDLHHESYWDLHVPGAEQWRSSLAVLLETNDDPQGVMVLLNEKTQAFTEVQLKLVLAAASQVAAAINNADLYHLIRDQAERLGTLVRMEQEESEKNSAIVESIADGVMLADAESSIVLFNGAAERILDLPRHRALGQPIFRLTGLFGGAASQWVEAVEKWTKQPQNHQTGEFLAQTLDLGKKVVRVHLSPVFIGERFLGTVSVFRDITREVEADRVKSEFVSNVSHELRTPMTSIKGFTDLLMASDSDDLSDTQKGFLAKVKTNADRLAQLVDDLLNISKIDAGEQLNLEMVDLGVLVPQVVKAVQERGEHLQKPMTVSVEVDPDLPYIQADSEKLNQIFSNILDNAFNYTRAGGDIRVKASLREDQASVLISVQDNGVGIPDEFKPRIFERFARYDDHALELDVYGTGLGLSIVKELVLMHNGEIWFDSELGKGTTFYVSLPLIQSEK
jgi:PAS domain S-box-containing protein